MKKIIQMFSKYEKIPKILRGLQYLLFGVSIFAIITVLVIFFGKPIQGEDRSTYASCFFVGFVIAIMLIVWFVDKEIERFNERKSSR